MTAANTYIRNYEICRSDASIHEERKENGCWSIVILHWLTLTKKNLLFDLWY